jgi:hypothetical protein
MALILKSHAEFHVPRQLQIVRANKWLPGVFAAAEKYGVSAALLLAIGSRETNLDPKYLRIAGDNGNGYGLTQVDHRSYPEWVQSGKWQIASECFLKTAEIIAESRQLYPTLVGQELTAKTMAGKKYSFVGAPIPDEETLDRIVIAAYNCGRWAYYHHSKGNDIDQGTTRGPSGFADYSADVIVRWEVFGRLLSEIPGK